MVLKFEELDGPDKLKVYLDYFIVNNQMKIVDGLNFNIMSFENFCKYSEHQKRSEGGRWLEIFEPRIFGDRKFSDYVKGVLKPRVYRNEDKLPLEIFKGIEHIANGTVFSDDVMYGKLFAMSDNGKFVYFIEREDGLVTDEYIKNVKKWFDINHVLVDGLIDFKPI